MSPGIYDISFKEYASIDAISNAALSQIAVSPATYKYWRDNPDEEATPSMKLGRIAHRSILEPDNFEAEFNNTYAVKPDGMKFSTSDGKAWKSAALDAGLEIVTFEQSMFLAGASKAIAAHPLASQMFSVGTPEQSLVADYNGIAIKARLDWLTGDGGNALPDLKTCESADPEKFYWTKIVGLRYYVQAAFYLDIAALLGRHYDSFCFLAIEKHPPYLISCHVVEPDPIEDGRAEYLRLLGRYAEAKRLDQWDGYPAVWNRCPSPKRWKQFQQEAA